jgi:hypothetical protein
MSPESEPLADGNIQLDYRLSVYVLASGEILMADGAEVFLDEHNIQWIKFYPKVGSDASKEHIVRTDQIYIVRDS